MIDELKRTSFFASFDEQALADIDTFARKLVFESGQRVFDQWDDAREVFLVLKGRVRQGYEVSPGTEVFFNTAEPGALIGLNALVPPRVHNMAATASEKSEVLAIDADRLLGYLDVNPRFGFVFMEQVARVLMHRLNNCRLQVIHLLPPKLEDGPTLPA
jgi:CRP-like cAMP-binding protein